MWSNQRSERRVYWIHSQPDERNVSEKRHINLLHRKTADSCRHDERIKEKFDKKVPRFNITSKADFHCCSLWVKPILRAQKAQKSLASDEASAEKIVQAFIIIAFSLRNIPLRAIQGCTTGKDTLKLMNKWNAAEIFVNKLSDFNNSLNLILKNEEDIGDHI